MSKQLRALQERKSELVAKARGLSKTAEAESRDLTNEEITQQEDYVAELQRVNAAIEREQALIEAETALEVPDDAVIEGGAPRIEQDPKRGFGNYGEFCMAVMGVSRDHVVDDRLRIGAAAPSTYGGEATGADGGFLVPPEFSREIWQHSLNEDSLVGLADNMPISGNSMTFPSDETTPWGTDGIRAYWEGEADAATATKPKLNPNTMRLKKLMALVPVSDELMADSTGLPAYLTSKTGQSIRWKTNDAIINGDGVGKPLGVAGHAAEVSVAKETSQTADTINANNVAKMRGRLLANNGMAGLRWLIHPDAFNQLFTMSVGNSPIWQPDFRVSAGGMLLGIPVIISHTCQTLGDKGDIRLIDFNSYRTITKAGGIETATSMHLYFDANAMAFRATFRIDGQPIVKSAVSAAKGSSTFSPYVTLAARA